MEDRKLKPEEQPVCMHPRPGFRFSVWDGIVIGVVAMASVGLWSTVRELAILMAFVVGHFFLFCNVFRIPRHYELVWSVLLIINVALWWEPGGWNWIGLVSQLGATLSVITWALLRPDYHGVGWRSVLKRQASSRLET